MRYLVLFISAFLPTTSSGQLLYLNPACKTSCADCVEHNPPLKVTYSADPKTQIVLRVFESADEKRVDAIPNCRDIDKNNWVCDGFGVMGEEGKQYAHNGIAIWTDWNDSEIDKRYLNRYSCRYEKSVFGSYRVIEEKRKY